MLWGRRAEPGHSIGHRHLERVHARSARLLLLVHALHLSAQQRLHIFHPCAADRAAFFTSLRPLPHNQGPLPEVKQLPVKHLDIRTGRSPGCCGSILQRLCFGQESSSTLSWYSPASHLLAS